MGILDIFKGKPKIPLIKVTNISLNWNGTTHTLEGLESPSKVFEIKIPFRNQVEGIMEVLKAQSSAPIVISAVESSQPFKILSVSPKLPANIDANSVQVFTIRVEGPAYKFEGPIQIRMVSDTSSFVHIDITKIMAVTSKGSVTLDEPPRTLSVPKGNVFSMHLQMYRVLSFGDRVGSIKVSDPFVLVSSEPKAPFSLDVKDSYVVELFIKVPDFNYAGNLEISFR